MSRVRAGTVNGFAIASTAPGRPRVQPVRNFRGGGRSRGSPSGPPSATHRGIRAISSSVSRRASADSAYPGTAFHGGLFLVATAFRILARREEASSYVRSGKGATLSDRKSVV